VKVVRSGELVKAMVPPSSSAMCLQMTRPQPWLPEGSFLEVTPARKIRFPSRELISGPLLLTLSRRRPWSSADQGESHHPFVLVGHRGKRVIHQVHHHFGQQPLFVEVAGGFRLQIHGKIHT